MRSPDYRGSFASVFFGSVGCVGGVPSVVVSLWRGGSRGWKRAVEGNGVEAPLKCLHCIPS